MFSVLEEVLGNYFFRVGDLGNLIEDREVKNYGGKFVNFFVFERSFLFFLKVLFLCCMLCWEAGRVGKVVVFRVFFCFYG